GCWWPPSRWPPTWGAGRRGSWPAPPSATSPSSAWRPPACGPCGSARRLPGGQEQQPRDRRRLPVLGRPRQEPLRGSRLLHPLDEQAGGGHGIDVAVERAVDEGEAHPRRHLLLRLVVGEVGPDAPVLLLEDVVVDPAAVRRLEQRVVEEEQEPPAGPEHPGHLGDGGGEVDDVLEHQA